MTRRDREIETEVRQLRGDDVRVARVPRIGSEFDAGNCECSGVLIQGSILDGDPTICCQGHDQLRGNFGGEIGVRDLWHQGGDVWSTFSDDETEDNPYEHECDDGTDEYDLVLDVSEDPPRIRIEPREALNCDPICVEWLLAPRTFQCHGTNLFEVGKSSGWPSGTSLPFARCVCLSPISTVLDCLDNCLGNVPRAWRITVEGAESPVGFCQECEDYNDEFIASWITAAEAAALESPVNLFCSPSDLCCWWIPPLQSICGGRYNPRVRVRRTGTIGNYTYSLQVTMIASGAIIEQSTPIDCSQTYTFENVGSIFSSCFKESNGVVVVEPLFDSPSDSGHCGGCE